MSTFVLKIIALIFMVIDHIGYFFITDKNMLTVARYIGRIAFPIFLFLSTVGFMKTSNKNKYLLRLGVFSIIEFIGNYFLQQISGDILKIDDNIFPTIFLNILIFYIIENLSKKCKVYKLLFKIVCLAISVFLISKVDYSYISLMTFTGYYIYLKNPKKLKNTTNKILFIIYEPILMIVSIFLVYKTQFQIDIQRWMITSIPFILLFNGKLGIKKDTTFYKIQKYFFYIFYMVHVWIFYIIKFIQKGIF